MTRLTSVTSDRVKAVRALHQRTGRRKAGRFLVEGPQAVRAALAAATGSPAGDGAVSRSHTASTPCGCCVCAMAASTRSSAGTTTARAVGAVVVPADERVLAAMAQTQQPQGVLAVCDLLTAPSPADLAARPGPLVVLDAVADPGNVGTIVRTAAAVGAAGVVLTPGSADPTSGKVVRSTAGALFALPVASGVEVGEAVMAARAAGRAVVVATGDAETDLFAAAREHRVDDRTCWVVGSEAHGVSAEARAVADLAVRIPMTGAVESLNAAVAAAAVLYVTAYTMSGASRPG